MPDRSIAAKINAPDKEAGTSAYSIDLVPRRELIGLGTKTVALTLKEGVTQGQVEALQAQLNLLVIDACLKH